MGLNAITNNNLMYDEVRFRVVPFGPPKTRDNEAHNPGRQKYSSEATRTYLPHEAQRFFHIDDLREYDQRSEWDSGPTDNNKLTDFVVDGAGYWSSPGGSNCDWDNISGAGDPHKMAGFSNVSSEADLTLLYSVGAGQQGTTNEGMEYGVVGLSGYFKPDIDNRDAANKSYAQIGLKRAYVMYRCDA